MAHTNIDLGEVDGIPVAMVEAVIRNLGDGLSKAQKVDPQLFHHGDTVYALVECKMIDLQFPEIPDANEVKRRHILKGLTLRLFKPNSVDGRTLTPLLDVQRDRIQALTDAETGAEAMALNEAGTVPTTPASERTPPGAGKAKKATAKTTKKAPAKRRTRKSPRAKKAATLTAVPDPE